MLKLGGRLVGLKCPDCGKKKIYLIKERRLGIATPNVECRVCGCQWTECPKTNLEVK